MSCTKENLTSCANCGKGEECDSDLKACTACNLVKYCNRDCQIAHRPQHKKACTKRAKELHEGELFKAPPLPEDCPICFLSLPMLHTGNQYQPCCGKIICSGCFNGVVEILDKDEQKCPFCRVPAAVPEEALERLKKRVEVGDTKAIGILGGYYREGEDGFPQDMNKAFEMWHRAGKLGNVTAYFNLGSAYYIGNGVEQDINKAKHYWELAAIGGDAGARYNLGRLEACAGNLDRTIKHLLFAVVGGYEDALNKIQQMYKSGVATKDDYAKALRARQAYLDEIRSDQRDEAAAYDEKFKYY